MVASRWDNYSWGMRGSSMSVQSTHRLPSGYGLFARYAYPPNELGYCGPTGSTELLHEPAELGTHAREFDGAWPYLDAIARAAGSDPLAPDVVRGYWVGGPLLDRVDPVALLAELQGAFKGQVTGLLDDVHGAGSALAHHSFHVFVVYPWVRFLERDPQTALRVLQNCRIRWGTVTAIDGEHVLLDSCPLVVDRGDIRLGAAVTERTRWSRDGSSLTAPPAPGDTVSAHWDWVCDTLTPAEGAALAEATRTTLHLVNTIRSGVGRQRESKGGRQ